jgi:hypothetical protein
MTKSDILQDISVELSKSVKKHLQHIKQLPSADKKQIEKLISNFKDGLDDLSESTVTEGKTYASSFGGFSKKLDGREIKIELKKRGYDTPNTGIWNKILVKKNGERMGMIDTDNSYYTKGGQMYKWRGTSNFIDHVEST